MTTKNKKPQQDQQMFFCECHSEGMLASKFPEDDLVYFSFWKQGVNPIKWDFRTRIAHCWRVITTGKAFVDEVVLSTHNTRKLCVFLSKITKSELDKK